MKVKHRQELVRLISLENIHFHSSDDVWPARLHEILSAVRKIETFKFADYINIARLENEQKPWRKTTKRRTDRIVDLALSCKAARQNEATWRLKIESEVLARFITKVTCKRCQGRLWQSEIQARIDPSDKFGGPLNLDERQRKRKPCHCNELDQILEQTTGISRIFHDRAEVLIQYCEDDPLLSALPKGEKPDRIYGLRETTRFKVRLDGKCIDPTLTNPVNFIRNSIETGPFNDPVEPVLFPFLVLEAKRDDGESFGNIEIQTAFAIKKLLDIQLGLKLATKERSQWNLGPFVWFLSNRGAIWRVAAAYVEEWSHVLHYHVGLLWEGEITSKDKALQLLLILDYVVDWARDTYREALLAELQTLAGHVGFDLYDDSEVCSLGRRSTVFANESILYQGRINLEELADPERLLQKKSFLPKPVKLSQQIWLRSWKPSEYGGGGFGQKRIQHRSRGVAHTNRAEMTDDEET